MAGKKRGGGGKSGPGALIMSIVFLFVIAGVIFGYAKANNINSIGALVDWSKVSSEKVKNCLQPDIKFWTCTFEGGGGGATPPGNGGETPPEETPGTEPGQSTADAMLQKLATIKVGDPQKVDYDRGQWKHWIGDRCNDTRQQVLKEQAISYVLDSEGCKVASGEWLDPYTGKKFTDPSKLDIDHVYALGAAAKNGGNGWDAATKQAFANDKTQLLAVSASANRSKSDRNPAEWWPENSAFSCQFATKYVEVASKYSLQFSQADVRALEKGLKTCS